MASLVKAAPSVSTVHRNLISLLLFTGCDTIYIPTDDIYSNHLHVHVLVNTYKIKAMF